MQSWQHVLERRLMVARAAVMVVGVLIRGKPASVARSQLLLAAGRPSPPCCKLGHSGAVDGLADVFAVCGAATSRARWSTTGRQTERSKSFENL